MINKVYISLGSNLGQKEQNINQAIILLNNSVGKIIKNSSIHFSEPWGFTSNNNFANKVIELLTELSPFELLNRTKLIEKKLGRTSKSINNIYTDRIIDIDILFYNDLILESENLTIPHKFIHEREFELIPLNEIACTYKHPIYNKTISKLLEELKQKSH